MSDLNSVVKCERFVQAGDDDHVNTPLREKGCTISEPPANCIATTAWNTDDENETTQVTELKCSPRFEDSDDNATPPRVAMNDENNYGNATPLRTTTNENDNVAKNLEIKSEPSRMNLELGFLDELADIDIERVLNQVRSRRAEIDQMNLKPLKSEAPNREAPAADDDEDEELRLLTAEHNKILEELRRRNVEKQLPSKPETAKKKKHKKEKKHKKRRSRSSSPESSCRRKQRRLDKSSNSKVDDEGNTRELDFVPVRDCEKKLKLVNITKLLPAKEATPKLSIKQKRQLAVERVKATLELLALQKTKKPPTEYLFVDTIRKLPGRSSVLCGANFENPSPLSNNFNVKYAFNSTTPNISLAKWGLEPLPAATVALLRLTGISGMRLMQLLEHSKMPLQKLRQQENALKASKGNDDDYMCTGLFRSLATQTDRNIGNRTRDVGIQTMPSASSNGVFWMDSRFCETKLSQQQANVVFALKELCATMPNSIYWADSIYKELHRALVIQRAEVKRMDSQKLYSRV